MITSMGTPQEQAWLQRRSRAVQFEFHFLGQLQDSKLLGKHLDSPRPRCRTLPLNMCSMGTILRFDLHLPSFATR